MPLVAPFMRGTSHSHLWLFQVEGDGQFTLLPLFGLLAYMHTKGPLHQFTDEIRRLFRTEEYC